MQAHLKYEASWVPLDQSYSLSLRNQAIANHLQNLVKKTEGIYPRSCQESILAQRQKEKQSNFNNTDFLATSSILVRASLGLAPG